MNTYDTQYFSESRANELLKTWKPLLEANDTNLRPLETKQKATMTAVLLENQYNYMRQNPAIYGKLPELVNEDLTSGGATSPYVSGAVVNGANGAEVTNGAGGTQTQTNSDFYATNDARVPNVIMPMIRRTFPELLANEICGVQPMSGPVGMAFALRFRYDNKDLADYSPDGANQLNAKAVYDATIAGGGDDAAATAAAQAVDPNFAAGGEYPWRSDSNVEAGYNYLNTGHTGRKTSEFTDVAGVFEHVEDDKGVAALLADTEMSTALPQMTMEIEKTAVEAGSRKLALKYSLELEQDIMSMHGIAVDDEMTSMMSYEIQAEIDREILIRMLNVALTNGEGAGYSIWSPQKADGRWSGERAVTLWQHLRVQARMISLRNRRGAANFAVATPYAATILETLPNFKPFEIDSKVDYQAGTSRAGSIGNIKVYVDTRSEAQYQAKTRTDRVDYILLGYKGAETWDAGLIYLPYIPVQIQRTMGANDFSPRIGLATRYAIAANLFGAENYYHVIVLKGLTEDMNAGDEAGQTQYMW